MALLLALAAWAVNSSTAACPAGTDATLNHLLVSPDDTTDLVIHEIHVANGDVFDLEDPRHDGFIHRLMNRLHIETAETVVRQQLLFSEGDVASADALAETGRYLRANRYLADAEVSSIDCGNGLADVQVSTTDAWSLIPSISFSRKGGQNFGGIELQETNLLGSGSELKLAYDSDIERDRLGVRYSDRQLGASRTGILVGYESYEVGYRARFDLEHPFYALDARRAGGIQVDIFDQLDPVYSLGERIYEVRHDARTFAGYFGRSRGLIDGHAIRWHFGIGYDEHHFEPAGDVTGLRRLPSDRRDVFPFIGLEWLQDNYEKTRNQDQMQRVEDRHMGTRLVARLGYAAKAFGSMQNALRFDAEASRGLHPAPNDTLMLGTRIEWRQPQGGRESHLVLADARYYHQQSDNRMAFANIHLATGKNLDTDHQLTLGGDTGLRGYPLRYLNGDTLALLTLEQRYFTDWYPFGLFRVGAAAFLDAGKVWGSPDFEPAATGILKNAGVGLRIGSPHSASGRMLHIDAAYALDGPQEIRGWQLYVESRTSF